VQDLGRAGDRVSPPPEGGAAAVVPFVLEVHRILDVAAESEPGGEVGGDLTVGRHRLVRHRPALGSEGGQPGQPRGQGGIQPQLALGPAPHAARAMHVNQHEVEPGS